MEHIFGEDDYSDGKHDNIDEKDDIDLECYIDAGEADYDKLFNSDWCPLLGRMPVANNMDDSSCENLSVGIIYNARRLWGITPMRQYTSIDYRIESTDDKPKEQHKYPQWRLNAAQAIARTYPKVKNEADIVGYQDERPLYSNTPLDENWKIAVEIVKKSLTVSLNALIKDYHILSILAIAEAWDVLKSILYHNKSEDNKDIASQVRVETALLGKAKELFLEEKNKQLEQDTENVKNKMWKYFANPENVHNQSNKAETVVEPVSETTKPNGQQEDKVVLTNEPLQDEPTDNYVFRKDGERWYIKFNDEVLKPENLDGFKYIHYLMELNKPITPKKLYQAVKGVKTLNKDEEYSVKTYTVNPREIEKAQLGKLKEIHSNTEIKEYINKQGIIDKAKIKKLAKDLKKSKEILLNQKSELEEEGRFTETEDIEGKIKDVQQKINIVTRAEFACAHILYDPSPSPSQKKSHPFDRICMFYHNSLSLCVYSWFLFWWVWEESVSVFIKVPLKNTYGYLIML